jgi:hypothetical protein
LQCVLGEEEVKGESSWKILQFIRRITHGGATFAGVIGEDIKDINHYMDINSLYPAIIAGLTKCLKYMGVVLKGKSLPSGSLIS